MTGDTLQDTNKQQNSLVYFFTRWSELKKKAHKVVRGHYVLLTVFILISSFLYTFYKVETISSLIKTVSPAVFA